MRAPKEISYKCRGVNSSSSRIDYLNISQLFDIELYDICETPTQHIKIEIDECYESFTSMTYLTLTMYNSVVYKLNIIDHNKKIKLYKSDKLQMKEVILNIKDEAKMILDTVYNLEFTKNLDL